MSITTALPTSIDETMALLSSEDYVASRALATVLFLSLRMKRPLFLEGEAGVGKTEIAKVLSTVLGRDLIRLQCYEGLDLAAAVYEWNYSAQMIEIRMAEAEGVDDRDRLQSDIFSDRFLMKRPLLRALEPHTGGAPVLLIDDVDSELDEERVARVMALVREMGQALVTTTKPGLVATHAAGARVLRMQCGRVS